MANKVFKTLKEARKGLKLPGGQDAEINTWGGEETYHWSKRGGYADKKMQSLRDSLRKARWVRSDHKGFAVPDGSVIGGTDYWTKWGWVVSISESYGGIKWDNSFGVSLGKVKA
jgi:hypothetical protein